MKYQLIKNNRTDRVNYFLNIVNYSLKTSVYVNKVKKLWLNYSKQTRDEWRA